MHKQENALILPARLMSSFTQMCTVNFVRLGNYLLLQFKAVAHACGQLISNRNAPVGRVLCGENGLVNMCISSNDQKYFCTQFLLISWCCFRKDKTFQINLLKTNKQTKLCLVHVSEMSGEQLLTKVIFPQETAIPFPVDHRALETQKVREHMILWSYLFSVFFKKYEMSVPFHLCLHHKSSLAAMAQATPCICCTCAPPYTAKSLFLLSSLGRTT